MGGERGGGSLTLFLTIFLTLVPKFKNLPTPMYFGDLFRKG